MAHGKSIGHLIDDANVFDSNYLEKGWRYNGAPSKWHLGVSNCHVTGDIT